jgi:YihY family inner membrane protein
VTVRSEQPAGGAPGSRAASAEAEVVAAAEHLKEGDERARGSFAALADRVDGFQQRHPVTSFPVAVVRKYSDDQGGRLTGQIAYSSVLAIFPLLFVLLTLVGIFLNGHKHLQDEVLNSAVRQFPVVGTDLANNFKNVPTAGSVGVYLVLLWLVYGALRLSRSAQAMMAVVWSVDRRTLPSFGKWLPRAVGFLVVLGLGFVGGGALAGIGGFRGFGDWLTWVGAAGTLVLNIAMFRLGYAVLLSRSPAGRTVWPGAVVAGVAWSAMQLAGVQLIHHQLGHLSNLYGTFATVLGLMWWMALGATVAVMAAECNAVLDGGAWPRSFRRTPTGTAPDPSDAGPSGRSG